MKIDKSKVHLTEMFKDWLDYRPTVNMAEQRPEIFPFSRIIWRTPKIGKEWRPIQQKIKQVEWETEYEMVKRGLRPCNVYQLDPKQFDTQIDQVMNDGLYYLSILRSATYQGFGHRHYPVSEINAENFENTFVYGVVADTYEHALEFKEAHLAKETDHKTIGRLLGYPECCTEFFCEIWLNAGCVDPMYETALNTDGAELVKRGEVRVWGNPIFNRLIRYWGFQCIPYFAHSYDCKESAKFADVFFGIMKEKAPDECEKLMEVLNMPMTWSVNNLIVEVQHPLFIGVVNGYYWPEKLTMHWEGEQ